MLKQSVTITTRRCVHSFDMHGADSLTLTPYYVLGADDYNVQEAQLMLTNPRDTFRGRSRSPNMVPFDMLRMVSY